MSNAKIDNNTFKWVTGELTNLEIIEDVLVLKEGFSIGMYTTVVFKTFSITGGNAKTKIEWISDETDGEINSTPGNLPKAIELRTSDVIPIDTNVIFGPTDLDPYYYTSMRQESVTEYWVGAPDSTGPVSFPGVSARWNISFGSGIVFGTPKTAVQTYVPGGVLLIETGADNRNIPADQVGTSARWITSYGVVEHNTHLESAYIGGGVFCIETSGSIAYT